MAPSRKRKRVEDHSPGLEEHNQPSENHIFEKEQEVWESFKDEHVETIEQVPLTLHRQYALAYELDQQLHGSSLFISTSATSISPLSIACTASLFPLLLQYDSSRKQQRYRAGGSSDTEASASRHDPPSYSQSVKERDIYQQISRNLTLHLPPHLSKSVVTTRKMMSRFAGFAGELIRASEEKVNITQASCDSVGRHVRVVQQAIKDQKALITLGARPGHLEPGNLSELTVGRWIKPIRANFSPIDGEDVNENIGLLETIHDSDAVEALQKLQITSTSKKNRGKGKASPKDDGISSMSSTLTITLPAQVSADEELYCTCRRGSFGEILLYHRPVTDSKSPAQELNMKISKY
ncbi:hypothetical protein H0H93_011542 [Arthromyces matolae]|nr:hypothetical protein H0H93_011542 [Arthromyces matolae]